MRHTQLRLSVAGAVGRLEKERLLQQRGCLLWFTGLSGSGKSTVACLVEQMLLAQGKLTKVIDGDNLRHGLNNGLGTGCPFHHLQSIHEGPLDFTAVLS